MFYDIAFRPHHRPGVNTMEFSKGMRGPTDRCAKVLSRASSSSGSCVSSVDARVFSGRSRMRAGHRSPRSIDQQRHRGARLTAGRLRATRGQIPQRLANSSQHGEIPLTVEVFGTFGLSARRGGECCCHDGPSTSQDRTGGRASRHRRFDTGVTACRYASFICGLWELTVSGGTDKERTVDGPAPATRADHLAARLLSVGVGVGPPCAAGPGSFRGAGR